MLSELTASEEMFGPEEGDMSRLYSAAGLDIGASAPAEMRAN